MRAVLWSALAVSVLASMAQADHVHLEGGRIIEGATKVEGDRLIIVLESGKIALPLSTIVKVEKKRPASEEAREREARIRNDDLEGLLELANYCREHDLRAKEHELLSRVLRIAPDHEVARRRLGYVRGKEGWISGPDRARERERARLDQRREELEKKREELELEKKRAELALTEARLERERATFAKERAEERESRREERRDDRPVYPSYYLAPRPHAPRSPAPPPPPPFLNGVRRPQDMDPSINGVRDPKTYFGDALRR